LDLFLGITVLILIAFTELLRRKKWVETVYARKILHIGAITASAFSVYAFSDIKLLFWIATASIPVLFIAVLLGFFNDSEKERRSYGIVYFAISFSVLLALFGQNRPDIVFCALFVLAWADGLAAVVGYRFAKRTWNFSPEGKSLIGSAAFGLSAFLGLMLSLLVLDIKGMDQLLAFALFLAIFLMVLEALALRGLDNLWIPAAVSYWFLLSPNLLEGWNPFWFILVPGLGYFAYYKRWLTDGGAFAAVLIGWILLINAEPVWVVPFVLFFLTGSLLSRLPGARTETSGRNANQVFSNGAIPVLCLMGYHLTELPELLTASISGVAFALSDTSSSEIGIRYGGRHFDFLRFRSGTKGQSGVVTIAGSAVGLLFAMVMAVAFYLISNSVTDALIVGAAGFFGNAADSIIGGTLQAKYQGKDGELVERRFNRRDQPVAGYSWVTNDTTNLLACFLASAMGFVLSHLL